MTAVEEEGRTVVPLKGIRRTAARRMVAAWEAPAFHLAVEADMGAALLVKERSPGATVTDAILAACAAALRDHPALNAHYADEAVTRFERVNVGMAVDTPAGLVVPVIKDAASLDVAGLADARRDIVQRARDGKLTMDDVTDGTFTVSNLGMMGIDGFDAILNVPQVAILAVGATRQQFVHTEDGNGTWRPRARLTLTCDHRAIDGATGARFLAAVRENLESS
ncbi:2-oxo acid dehydrogenase subunit E2 [Pseudarthrobacter sp. NPDC092424]|uniref:2-oxo acid dehydrogenase subunit E2 n=1 Tax=Pseudarthrobacter sp. NPDC092424 TaxID=3364415 RepID=UPI0037F6E1E4